MKEQIDIFDDLLIEFDEMGFVPTNFLPDHDSEYYAIDWRNRLINALEGYRKQTEWISVEDRLPEANVYVFLYVFFHNQWQIVRGWLSYCDKKFHITNSDYPSLTDIPVTHWMPLPEPPKMMKEQRQGRWLMQVKDGFIHYKCPFCETLSVYVKEGHFAPDECRACGAKMKGGE